ncbi:MAG TPA: SAM-dependent chlorinase/fluorinase [Vicinamibacteria bacterium]|nr:SAM-dependent chlorinase/fluorinase [Vicinamibacteria bacterium]
MPPVIALLTDFGLRDHYVGAMKGAILSVCPEATLVDVTHEVPAHDVAAGALALAAAYPHFPGGSVFVGVVDPGVGSERRPIAVGAGRWLFVGPDNGLFTLVLDADPSARVRLLAMPVLFRAPLSPVFHGRDLFGPAAGRLAAGLPLDEVGPAVPDPVRLALPRQARVEGGWEGAVVHVDRFGNLTTNLVEADLHALAGPTLDSLEVGLGERWLPLVRAYAEVDEGRPCALVGSSGRLEIAVRSGRADALTGAGPGTPVRVRRRGSAC